MQALKAATKLKILGSNEAGISLLETLIALALLGIIAVGLLSGLSTTFKAVMVSQERTIVESLAKSQLEYIKTQVYIPTADYDPADPSKRYGLIDIPQELADKGYDIEINPPLIIINPGETGYELQSITVVIKRNDEEMLTISDYKVGRLT